MSTKAEEIAVSKNHRPNFHVRESDDRLQQTKCFNK